MELTVNVKQERGKSHDPIIEPASLDILCGRNETAIRHTGNICFRSVICLSLDEFETLSSMVKRKNLYNAIVTSIKISGGRFLRRQHETAEWDEVSDEGAKLKVRHAFRDMTTTRRKQRKGQEVGNSPIFKSYFNSPFEFDWKRIVMVGESINRADSHDVVLEPTDMDILHGRSDFSIHHIGNLCFHVVIGCSLKDYKRLSTRSEKSEFLNAIVLTIHNAGGRLLHRQPRAEGWEQDDVRKAKQMVGQALRDAVKKPDVVTSALRMKKCELHGMYRTHYNFSWRGIVETIRVQQSGMKEAKLVDGNLSWEEDLSDSFSDSTFCFQMFSDDVSLTDTLCSLPFNKKKGVTWL